MPAMSNSLSAAVGRVASPQEIAELPVKFAAAVMPMRVKDLAEVRDWPRISHRRSDPQRPGSRAWGRHDADGREQPRRRRAGCRESARFKSSCPPAWLSTPNTTGKIWCTGRFARSATNLFEGALLVVAVLLFLLGNWRAALIVATAIPLAFLFAITGMTRFGISGNLMSLGAIDFGLIIDGAVVIVENIVRQLGAKQHQLGRRLTTEERLHTVVGASKQVGTPMFFGVSDYRDCLSADSRAFRHRRKDVSSDGADGHAGSRRITGPGIDFNAGALFVSCCGAKSRNGITRSSVFCKRVYAPILSSLVAIAVAGCARSGGAVCVWRSSSLRV